MRFRVSCIGLVGLCLLSPGAGNAAPFTRRASLGLMDVPVAETIGRASASLGLEYFLERNPGGWGALPLPISVVAGLGSRFDAGLSAQFGGLPGDAQLPGVPVLNWTLAAKYLALPQAGSWPGLAVEAQVDRPTANLRTSLRAIASSPRWGAFRVTGFAGAELGFGPVLVSPNVGVAFIGRHRSGVEGIVEGLYSSRGWLAGAGVRWGFAEYLGATASVTWLPLESTVRVSVGVAVFFEQPPPPPAPRVDLAAEDGVPSAQLAGPRRYLDDRPQFRLRIRLPRSPDDPAGRHHQWAPAVPGEDESSTPKGEEPLPP